MEVTFLEDDSGVALPRPSEVGIPGSRDFTVVDNIPVAVATASSGGGDPSVTQSL